MRSTCASGSARWWCNTAETATNRAAVVWGIFFVLAGLAFLLDRLGVWNLRARYLVPLLLIALGVAILVGGRRPSRHSG
jgi:cytochrome c oxidase subunit IV